VKISRLAALFLALSFPSLTFAQHYTQTNLVTDMGSSAPVTDSNLKNAWGLSRNTGSPWWCRTMATGVSTLYNIAGTTSTLAATVNPLVVVIPLPWIHLYIPLPPTSVQRQRRFHSCSGDPCAIYFCNGRRDHLRMESGLRSEQRSPQGGQFTNAVYKGVTTGDVDGVRYLYVANFRSGHIEIYDTNFKAVLSSNDHGESIMGFSLKKVFDDGEIPEGYAHSYPKYWRKPVRGVRQARMLHAMTT